MTELKFDPERLEVLAADRKRANERALDAQDAANSVAEDMKAAEAELHEAEAAFNRNYRGRATGPNGGRMQEQIEELRAKVDRARRKRDEARAAHEQASEDFQSAARLFDRCHEFALKNGLTIPDRGRATVSRVMS